LEVFMESRRVTSAVIDGSASFSSDERRFKRVESTAQALITLATTGHAHDRFVELALAALSAQIRPEDGSVRSSSNAVDQGWPDGPVLERTDPDFPPDSGIKRTYPAALTLMALAAWEGDAADISLVKGFLLTEFPSGIWGAFPEAVPRPAFTAAASWALMIAGEPRSRFESAGSYLRSTQRRDGHWPKEEEVWSVRRADVDLISSSRIDTTAWCAGALRAMGGIRNLHAAGRARHYFARRS
jgi:hypothetical protein